MTEEHRQTFIDFFNNLYGNNDAVSLSMMLLEVCHIWDDLIDKDRKVSDDQINMVFKYLIYDIPKNRIYQLMPSMPDHLLSVYLQWRDATSIENGAPSDEDLNKCYMLRAGIYNIFAIISYHVNGDNVDVGPMIRRLYGESLEDYKKEINNA